MKRIDLQFTGSQDHLLSARLDMPETARPDAYAVFAHCFTCNKNYKAINNISRSLAQCNIAVLRFDFTGLGESDGDFAHTNFSSNVEDMIAAAHYLEQHYEAPRILIGHSLGGAAVLQAAGEIASCTAVVTIAAPADPGHVLRLFSDKKADIERDGQAEISVGGQTFRITRTFFEELDHDRMARNISRLGPALLVCHSPDDRTVDMSNAEEIFALASHPKSFLCLDGADHLLSRESDSRYVAHMIATWAGHYIGHEE